MYVDVRRAIDLCHRDGSLKQAVAADPGRCVRGGEPPPLEGEGEPPPVGRGRPVPQGRVPRAGRGGRPGQACARERAPPPRLPPLLRPGLPLCLRLPPLSPVGPPLSLPPSLIYTLQAHPLLPYSLTPSLIYTLQAHPAPTSPILTHRRNPPTIFFPPGTSTRTSLLCRCCACCGGRAARPSC